MVERTSARRPACKAGRKQDETVFGSIISKPVPLRTFSRMQRLVCLSLLAASASGDRVPLVDLSPLLDTGSEDTASAAAAAAAARAIAAAAADLGAFRIRGHGADIERALIEIKAFFALPEVREESFFSSDTMHSVDLCFATPLDHIVTRQSLESSRWVLRVRRRAPPPRAGREARGVDAARRRRRAGRAGLLPRLRAARERGWPRSLRGAQGGPVTRAVFTRPPVNDVMHAHSEPAGELKMCHTSL